MTVFDELNKLEEAFRKEVKNYFEAKNKAEKIKKRLEEMTKHGQSLVKEANFTFDLKHYKQEDFIEVEIEEVEEVDFLNLL